MLKQEDIIRIVVLELSLKTKKSYNPMTKKREEKREAWFRILVFIISGIILSAWAVLVKVLAIINWFVTIFSGKRNRGIAEFCEYWNTEVYKFLRYLTFVSNKRPFPFNKLGRISKFEK